MSPLVAELARCMDCSDCSLWAQLQHPALQLRPSGCGTQAQPPAACGIFLDLGSNPCLLHRQEDSLPLSQHGSPQEYIIFLY